MRGKLDIFDNDEFNKSFNNTFIGEEIKNRQEVQKLYEKLTNSDYSESKKRKHEDLIKKQDDLFLKGMVLVPQENVGTFDWNDCKQVSTGVINDKKVVKLKKENSLQKYTFKDEAKRVDGISVPKPSDRMSSEKYDSVIRVKNRNLSSKVVQVLLPKASLIVGKQTAAVYALYFLFRNVDGKEKTMINLIENTDYAHINFVKNCDDLLGKSWANPKTVANSLECSERTVKDILNCLCKLELMEKIVLSDGVKQIVSTKTSYGNIFDTTKDISSKFQKEDEKRTDVIFNEDKHFFTMYGFKHYKFNDEEKFGKFNKKFEEILLEMKKDEICKKHSSLLTQELEEKIEKEFKKLKKRFEDIDKAYEPNHDFLESISIENLTRSVSNSESIKSGLALTVLNIFITNQVKAKVAHSIDKNIICEYTGSLKDLASKCAVSRQTLNYQLDKLEKYGFIDRKDINPRAKGDSTVKFRVVKDHVYATGKELSELKEKYMSKFDSSFFDNMKKDDTLGKAKNEIDLLEKKIANMPNSVKTKYLNDKELEYFIRTASGRQYWFFSRELAEKMKLNNNIRKRMEDMMNRTKSGIVKKRIEDTIAFSELTKTNNVDDSEITVAAEKSEKTEKFICPVCCKEFKSFKTLKNHLKKASDDDHSMVTYMIKPEVLESKEDIDKEFLLDAFNKISDIYDRRATAQQKRDAKLNSVVNNFYKTGDRKLEVNKAKSDVLQLNKLINDDIINLEEAINGVNFMAKKRYKYINFSNFETIAKNSKTFNEFEKTKNDSQSAAYVVNKFYKKLKVDLNDVDDLTLIQNVKTMQSMLAKGYSLYDLKFMTFDMVLKDVKVFNYLKAKTEKDFEDLRNNDFILRYPSKKVLIDSLLKDEVFYKRLAIDGDQNYYDVYTLRKMRDDILNGNIDFSKFKNSTSIYKDIAFSIADTVILKKLFKCNCTVQEYISKIKLS